MQISITKMKYVYLLLAFFTYININAQSFEFAGGIVKNKYFDTEDNRPYDYSSYSSGLSNFVGIGFNKIRWAEVDFGVTVSYENYGGELYGTSGGRGGGRKAKAEVDNSILSLGIFPINQKIYKNLHISLGVQVSVLVRETYIGTDKFSILLNPSMNRDDKIEEKYESYSTPFLVGFKGKLSYPIKLSKTYSIAPHYSYYIGLQQEFIDFPRETKSMRHNLGIAVIREL